MKMTLKVVGWSLRASALICMVWILAQVVGGTIDSLTLLLSSVVWHAAFALSGVALVGAATEPEQPEHVQIAGARPGSSD